MARLKKVTVFPNYIRAAEPNHELLANLILKAKGEKRSLTHFAKQCDVNASTLSRIVNQKNSGPCADSIIKKVAENADPESGVTLEQLLAAHGLAEIQLQRSPITDVEYASLSDIVIKLDEMAQGQEGGSAELIHQTAAYMKGIQFEKDAQEIIATELLRKGYTVKLVQNPRQYRYDFCIETDALIEQDIDRWHFEVKIIGGPRSMRFLDRLFRDLYFDSTYDKREMVSLVIADMTAFQDMVRQFTNAEIYDAVSIILIDRINRKVADEFIIPQKGMPKRKSILR